MRMRNPKEMVVNYLRTNSHPMFPMINKLMSMSYPELEQFATNYCKERGIDFPQALEQIKRIWG